MRRTTLLALATGVLALQAATVAPAGADEPERTAWYTALTVGPVAAPAPAVAEGDLQVAGTGSRPTSYAALALAAPAGAGGELVLAVRRATGTPEVAACPTKTDDWEAGGGQPFSAGPEYDCAAATVPGTLAADGRTISFPLDSSLRTGDGPFSIALAPLPESSAPFSIDLGDPVFTPEEVAPAAEPAAEPAADPGAPADPAPAPALEPALEPADAPPQLAAEDPVAAELPAVAEAPPLVEADPPEVTAADTPVEQPLAAPDPGLPVAPDAVLPGAELAAAAPAGEATGPRLLALLALVAVSAGAGYAAGQQRPAPRLLGGRARALPGGGAPGGVVAVAEPAPALLPRGIGRFSRVRENAPRRLR